MVICVCVYACARMCVYSGGKCKAVCICYRTHSCLSPHGSAPKYAEKHFINCILNKCVKLFKMPFYFFKLCVPSSWSAPGLNWALEAAPGSLQSKLE